MHNLTDRELNDMIARRDDYASEGMIIGLMIAACFGFLVGVAVGWWVS